jgi:hypothetical protein
MHVVIVSNKVAMRVGLLTVVFITEEVRIGIIVHFLDDVINRLDGATLFVVSIVN